MVKAILFDMDGVLIDSCETHFYAFNTTIKKYGAKGVSHKIFIKKFWGKYIELDIEVVFGNIPKEKLSEIVEDYPIQVKKFVNYTKIYSDTKSSLKKLKRKGLKLGIITSSQKRIVEMLMKHVGLHDYFNIIISGDQVKRPKPAPDGIIKACKSLKIKPSEVIYIGDNNLDVIAGKSAGCLTIGIMTTSNIEKLKGADLIIEKLTQILELEEIMGQF